MTSLLLAVLLAGPAPAPLHSDLPLERALASLQLDDCLPDDCLERGQVWAPMWDLRREEMRWEILADGSGEVAVGAYLDFHGGWEIEVLAPDGTTVAAIEPELFPGTYEAGFCSSPGSVYTVVVRHPYRKGLHYRMYWRGILWARTTSPLESDAVVGFDKRWHDVSAHFAKTIWFFEVPEGSKEIVMSVEAVSGDASGPIRYLPPDGCPDPGVGPYSIPRSYRQHWPARFDDCWGFHMVWPMPPPPTRECDYYDIFDPVPDPCPGWWGLQFEATCDGDPDTPEPECEPYSFHYILARHDDGPKWLYLNRNSFESGEVVAAIGVAQQDCGEVLLDASGSVVVDPPAEYRWTDGEGNLLGEGPQLATDLGPGCHTVRLVVSDRCGLWDDAEVEILDEVPPVLECPGGGAPVEIAVDRACRGLFEEPATVRDDCTPGLEAAPDPELPLVATLAPGECRREESVSYSAIDACDNEGGCVARIEFADRSAPEIRCPADPDATPDRFEREVDGTCATTFDERASAEDNCDGSVAALPSPALPLTIRLDPGECLREVPVSYETDDSCGNAASCAIAVEVRDETPPAIACPQDGDATPELFEIPADERCEGVYHERATAADNCADPVPVSDPPLPIRLSKPDLDRPVPVAYLADDGCGNEAACSVETVLVDETPPVIEEVRFDGACLWPPNHKWICLEIAEEVRWRDNCTAPGEGCGGVRALSCRSDQPDDGLGDGRAAPDCRIGGEGERVCLRSERQGPVKEGRSYEVVVEATDCSGNATVGQATLLVPHDRHRGDGSCAREIVP